MAGIIVTGSSLYALRRAVSFVMVEHAPLRLAGRVTCEVCVAHHADDGFTTFQEWPCDTARALCTGWPVDEVSRERWAWTEVGPGWYPLLDRVAVEMAAIDALALLVSVTVEWGFLRIVWTEDLVAPEKWGLVCRVVSRAEEDSMSICEQCSRPCEVRNTGPGVHGGTTVCHVCLNHDKGRV